MASNIVRRYSMVKRYGVIIDTLVKYGFGYFVDQMGIRSLGSLRSRFKDRLGRGHEPRTGPARARMVLEELGPTYVKFGQLMSMRQDLIPKEYAEEFAKLQNDVPPFDYSEVERIIEEELGDKVENLFLSFEKTPIAAASIAQVHRAKLLGGADIVVKVQRPGIRKVIDSDLDILYSIAGFAEEHVEEAKLYSPVEVVDELQKSIYLEMDFTQEGRNIERFQNNFRDDPNIVIPGVYWEYSSRRVLTLDYIDGIKSDNFEKIDELGLDRDKLAEHGTEAFMKQIFEDGFFHADMHSGNVLILEDGRIALLDFGMVGHISHEIRNLLIDALIAITRGDVNQYLEVLKDFGMVPDNIDVQAFKIDYEHVLNKYYGRSLKQLDTPLMIAEMMTLLRKFKIRIPPNIALLFKGVMTVSGFALQMVPDFNVTVIAEPYARNIMRTRFKPRNIADNLYTDMWHTARMLHKAPLQISHILSIAEKGYLNLRFEHKGMDRIVAELNAASNRLSFSLIISSIILGSSLIIQTGMQPHIGGVPLFGVAGFVIAAFMGLWLMVYILKTGKI
ncbi:AarF/ABC1/UbiB kinase family protein [Methanococcoides methylutens]|uniref:ABC1 family protein n=1 Tax=Methanococcoides methylutens MM1 TaxID=1434104 RepID=A0A0E3STT7_METMT|nr:AarF/ABC1/UbiB kinase family protein [Methanococcoides methylutens]AKB86187.1 ABC1 family protein [Methanococcoides methylutens MM1]